MIIEQKKTTLAYRCPKCGGVPTSMVGAFSLSAELFKLKCSCGGSHMTVEKLPEGKLRLTVPCLTCPDSHIFNLTSDVFFNNSVLMLPCSINGIDLCFVGNEQAVAQAVSRSNEEIVKMLGDNAIERLKSEEKPYLTDPQVLEIITYVVHEMNDEGCIYCGCNPGEGEYECNVYNDFVTVKCKKCHKSATIPAESTIAAHDFLNADKLTLS
ncbi:MAG: hypothetical protein IJX02_03630 [Clostridia bacterium]|nr:hypothetical protein [Clostridia bacterium]